MIKKLNLYFVLNGDNHLATFYQENFPGFEMTQEVADLSPLLTSSDPDAFMKSKAIVDTDKLCSAPIPSSGVYFINVLCMHFSYFQIRSKPNFKQEKAAQNTFVLKMHK